MGKKVIELARVAPDAALQGLNRLTGLNFSSWPESLVNPGPEGVSSRSEAVEESSPAIPGSRLDGQREKKQA